jgi:hypothetical protein
MSYLSTLSFSMNGGTGTTMGSNKARREPLEHQLQRQMMEGSLAIEELRSLIFDYRIQTAARALTPRKSCSHILA